MSEEQDKSPQSPGDEPEPATYRIHTEGFWTEHGFWQLMPPTGFHHEPPELTAEEQLEAAMRYIRRRYGGEDEPQ